MNTTEKGIKLNDFVGRKIQNNMDEEVKPTYTIYTDMMDDFRKEEFLAILETLENMGCRIS